MKFRVIDGCPVPASVAPYIFLVLQGAGQAASSIYRGDDAAALLHRHGKHTQAEIHRMLPAISNPPGQSQHELRSDGNANRGPIGRRLESWQVGVDSGGDDTASKLAVRRAASRHGWHIEHPYSRGVEGHHWCFSRRPRPHSWRMRARIVLIRARLPRK